MDKSDSLLADDPLYEELYDVRREAEYTGNFVEEDIVPLMCALQEKGPVHKGFLRELMGLPQHFRHPAAKGRIAYTSFSFPACEAAFRDNINFSNDIYHMAPDDDPTLMLLEFDNPVHRAFRKTVQPMFIKPRADSWWRKNWIDGIMEALIGSFHGKSSIELNLQLCARVPVHTITRAIGMDGEATLIFRHALMISLSERVPAQQRMESGALVEKMLLELIAQRRLEPGDDVISGMIGAEMDLPDGRRTLTDHEMMMMARLILIAGGGTSWRQFGITLWGLLTNRDQLEDLKADRSLMDAAIEESVRWNPTDPVFDRSVLNDTELGGVLLPKGSVLEICLAAANRDPARWDNPHVYDLHRPKHFHLGFGLGNHMCLGRSVAASEINAGINALLDHFPNIRLDPDAPAPFMTGGVEQRGISGLHVLLD